MPHHRYKLPDLTYAYNALIPTISEEIMRLHHDKHHLAYVNGANAALDKLQKARETGFAGVDVKATPTSANSTRSKNSSAPPPNKLKEAAGQY